MIETVNLYVFIFGSVSLVIPFLAGLYFWKDRNGLGRKLAWLFFAQANAIVITLIFGYQSVAHGYNATPPLESAVLRFFLFFPQVIATALLIHYLLAEMQRDRNL